MTKLQVMTTRLPVPLVKELKRASKDTGRKLESMMAEAVAKYLEDMKRASAA